MYYLCVWFFVVVVVEFVLWNSLWKCMSRKSKVIVKKKQKKQKEQRKRG